MDDNYEGSKIIRHIRERLDELQEGIMAGNFTNYVMQPLYIGNNTEFVDNKFTRQFVDPTNNQQTKTRSFLLPTVEDIEDKRADSSLPQDFSNWYGDKK